MKAKKVKTRTRTKTRRTVLQSGDADLQAAAA